MAALLLSVALNCPNPVIVNTSGFPWNDHDKNTLDYAKKRCSEIYEDSPCVKWFKKWGKQDYSVICGSASSQS